MNHRQKNYQSYLLRIWQESDSETCRATLENIITHERFSFPNLTALFSFLAEQTITDLDKKDIVILQNKNKKIPVYQDSSPNDF